MRKWSWLFMAVGVALTPGSSAARVLITPQTAATPACVVKKIVINQMTRQISVQGGCTLRGKPIPTTARYSYTSSDTDKYSCGVSKGLAARGKFVLGPAGIASASGSLRYLPKAKYRRVASRAKAFRAVMNGSDNLQCGKPVNLPSPSVLCDRSQWPPYGWPASLVTNCGQPVSGGVSFSSPMTLVDGVLSAGHVVSPPGRCVFGPWNDPDFNQPGVRLLCSDDVGAVVYLSYGLVADSRGDFCPDPLYPTYTGQRKMDIPRDWKGTLYFVAGVVSYKNWSTTHNRIGGETQTAKFQLQGTQEPC